MPHRANFSNLTLITPTAKMSADVHGGRAKCLQRLVRLDMPVPTTVSLDFKSVQSIASGTMPDMERVDRTLWRGAVVVCTAQQ